MGCVTQTVWYTRSNLSIYYFSRYCYHICGYLSERHRPVTAINAISGTDLVTTDAHSRERKKSTGQAKVRAEGTWRQSVFRPASERGSPPVLDGTDPTMGRRATEWKGLRPDLASRGRASKYLMPRPRFRGSPEPSTFGALPAGSLAFGPLRFPGELRRVYTAESTAFRNSEWLLGLVRVTHELSFLEADVGLAFVS